MDNHELYPKSVTLINVHTNVSPAPGIEPGTIAWLKASVCLRPYIHVPYKLMVSLRDPINVKYVGYIHHITTYHEFIYLLILGNYYSANTSDVNSVCLFLRTSQLAFTGRMSAVT